MARHRNVIHAIRCTPLLPPDVRTLSIQLAPCARENLSDLRKQQLPCSSQKMNVLIACEFSGIVRDAFHRRGHNAWSCDILPTEKQGNHFHCSILSQEILKRKWDLMIAHPDCTFLTVSGARWMKIPWRKEAKLFSLHFVKALWKFPIKRIAIENPVGVLSTLWMPPTQVIHPWQFGHGEKKTTCLWLKNLPPLEPTKIVRGRQPKVHWEWPGGQRGRKIVQEPTSGLPKRWPNSGEI